MPDVHRLSVHVGACAACCTLKPERMFVAAAHLRQNGKEQQNSHYRPRALKRADGESLPVLRSGDRDSSSSSYLGGPPAGASPRLRGNVKPRSAALRADMSEAAAGRRGSLRRPASAPNQDREEQPQERPKMWKGAPRAKKPSISTPDEKPEPKRRPRSRLRPPSAPVRASNPIDLVSDSDSDGGGAAGAGGAKLTPETVQRQQRKPATCAPWGEWPGVGAVGEAEQRRRQHQALPGLCGTEVRTATSGFYVISPR